MSFGENITFISHKNIHSFLIQAFTDRTDAFQFDWQEETMMRIYIYKHSNGWIL